MNQHQQIIQLAKQTALKKFSLLVQRMAQNSDQEFAKALSVNSPSTDYSTLNAARHFLRKGGDELLHRIEALYQQKLDQALRAMYSNERVEVTSFKAANLSLIDDQTINRQIEVGHLVGRLSASCSESLGRVNFIISQLLEKPDVREKDNPFRPELIAHTLHEVLAIMVQDEGVRNFLLNYSTNSLAIYLPEYYVELCEVFKHGGISPKIFTRPTSRLARQAEQPVRPGTERRLGEPRDDVSGAGPGHTGSSLAAIPADALPGLQRLLDLMQQSGSAGTGGSGQGFAIGGQSDTVQVNPMLAFQALINRLLGASNSTQIDPVTGMATPGGLAGANASMPVELLARLDGFQRLVASGRGVDGQVASQANQLSAIGAQLDDKIASQSERMALELIAILFELIGRDQQIPEGLRDQIGRLQIPFAKSAIMDPATLQQSDHPTRKLLNHMGMVSVGLPSDSQIGQDVDSEIKRIVKTILTDFNKDSGIFVNCLDELKKFMDEELRRSDAAAKHNIEVIEKIERVNYLTFSISAALHDVLMPLHLDRRVVDFCLQIWVHVLVKATIKIPKVDDEASKSTQAKLQLFFNALPELVWSAQEKSSTEDRLLLIKLLPKLVKILKSGMAALRMPEDESKRALDHLLAVHAQVLANNDGAFNRRLPTLEELRELFKDVAMQDENSTSKAMVQPSYDADQLQAALAKKGISAELFINPPDGYGGDIEQEWLDDMQVGTRIECRIDGGNQIGRLIWVGKQQSLYMFRLDRSPKSLVYCPVSLSRALRNGSMMFVESAPTFERAVETLLQQADLMKKLGGAV